MDLALPTCGCSSVRNVLTSGISGLFVYVFGCFSTEQHPFGASKQVFINKHIVVSDVTLTQTKRFSSDVTLTKQQFVRMSF